MFRSVSQKVLFPVEKSAPLLKSKARNIHYHLIRENLDWFNGMTLFTAIRLI